ncbi:MAG: RidA family protein [Roseicyclus sp.]|nr:RidA family protein [Roseicyclus sp.]MBO6625802.1 RidA family protein [Roseicyclus sp.]MBO6921802.1 RidA family protein [Roseicyclus sp.]
MTERSIAPEGFEGYLRDWKMSPALVVGDLVFLTGMTGAGPDGTVNPDPVVQIELAFERVRIVLEAAGARMVEMTSYHVGLQDHIGAFREIRARHVSEPYPAWTAIEVQGFVTPGTLVELRVVARIEGKTE